MSLFEFANRIGTTNGGTQLEESRNRAIRYYNSIIYPATPESFDKINPRPRIALEKELALIGAKYRKDLGR